MNTSTSLSVFNFAPGMDLRVIDRAGDPWFITKDVCRVLTIANPSQAVKVLGDDEKGIQIVETLGWPQRIGVVSESGLYALIMRSNKPSAQRFRKWVTSVVLPAIRKDGGYILGEEKVVTGEMSEDELMARAVLVSCWGLSKPCSLGRTAPVTTWSAV